MELRDDVCCNAHLFHGLFMELRDDVCCNAHLFHGPFMELRDDVCCNAHLFHGLFMELRDDVCCVQLEREMKELKASLTSDQNTATTEYKHK